MPSNIFRIAAARPLGEDYPQPPPVRMTSEIEQRLRDDRPVHMEIRGPEPMTFRDHIAEAFHDPRFTFFLGGYVGVVLTVLSAVINAGLL